MVRFVSPNDNAGSDSIGARERLRFLRFNIEHCEMYWQRGADEVDDWEPVVVLLVDCTDTVGAMLAARLVGPERSAQTLADCIRLGVIPTMHVALPLLQVLQYLRAIQSSFVETIQRCPADCFPILVIAAGGQSLAYRERPALSPVSDWPVSDRET